MALFGGKGERADGGGSRAKGGVANEAGAGVDYPFAHRRIHCALYRRHRHLDVAQAVVAGNGTGNRSPEP
ncbi:hypothetical protein D3C87_1689470 [compost metagenome]